MNSIEEKYFDLFFNKRITEYIKIEDYKIFKPGEAKMKYKSLNEFYCEELNINADELKLIVLYFERFKNIFDKYINEDRKDFFSNYNRLMSWYEEQKNSVGEIQCGYCNITESKLKVIIKNRGGKLTLNGKTKRSLGTMEIEKLNSEGAYTYDNCIMACPLCNNAKSNLISDKDWRAFFVEPMKNYYQKELK